jgi:hypothetical protein
MVILMTRDMTAMEPTSLRYWGVMSLASLAGFVLAYPVNWWLVAVGLKHGMGTVRALGKGGHGLAVERQMFGAASGEAPPPAATTRTDGMDTSSAGIGGHPGVQAHGGAHGQRG